MASKNITVLVADRHSVTRAGVKAILRGCKVLEASNGREAVRLARKHRPQVAVLAIEMPELNGLDAAHQIMTSGNTRVMLLTDDNRDFTLARVNYFGIHGYLCKSSPIDMLPTAVKVLLSGQTWYEPIMRQYIARHALMPKLDPLPELTRREIELLQLIGESKANKYIGSVLEISENTVEKHRQNLMKKINIHTTAGLVHYAIQAGLVTAK